MLYNSNMKTKHMLGTLGAMMLCVSVFAQTDTAAGKPTIIDGKRMKITIETKMKKDQDGTSKIIIDGDTTILDEGDPNSNASPEIITREEKIIVKDYKKSDAGKNQMSWFNFDLGFNFLASGNSLDMPEPYKDLELENGKGCNFNLRIYEQSIDLIHKHLFLVYGAGLDWNNYRFKNNVDLLKDSATLSYTLNTARDYNKNKLVSTYLTVPVMLKVRFKENKDGDAFQIAAGPQFGYLINSHIKQKWEEDGDHKQKVRGDYNLNEFRIGYSLYFGYKNIMFYARYYPTPTFKSQQGPDVNTVSLGLSFGGGNNNQNL